MIPKTAPIRIVPPEGPEYTVPPAKPQGPRASTTTPASVPAAAGHPQVGAPRGPLKLFDLDKATPQQIREFAANLMTTQAKAGVMHEGSAWSVHSVEGVMLGKIACMQLWIENGKGDCSAITVAT